MALPGSSTNAPFQTAAHFPEPSSPRNRITRSVPLTGIELRVVGCESYTFHVHSGGPTPELRVLGFQLPVSAARHALDFNEPPARQAAHFHNRAGRLVVAEEGLVNLVEGGKLRHIHQENVY